MVEIYPLVRAHTAITAPAIKKAMAKFRQCDVNYISLDHKVYQISGVWNGLLWDGKKPIEDLASSYGEIHIIRGDWVAFLDIQRIRSLVEAIILQLDALGLQCTDQVFLDCIHFSRDDFAPAGLLRALIGAREVLEDYKPLLVPEIFNLLKMGESYLREHGVRQKRKTCSKCWGRKVISSSTVTLGMAQIFTHSDPNVVSPCDKCSNT